MHPKPSPKKLTNCFQYARSPQRPETLRRGQFGCRALRDGRRLFRLPHRVVAQVLACPTRALCFELRLPAADWNNAVTFTARASYIHRHR